MDKHQQLFNEKLQERICTVPFPWGEISPKYLLDVAKRALAHHTPATLEVNTSEYIRFIAECNRITNPDLSETGTGAPVMLPTVHTAIAAIRPCSPYQLGMPVEKYGELVSVLDEVAEIWNKEADPHVQAVAEEVRKIMLQEQASAQAKAKLSNKGGKSNRIILKS